MQVGRFEREYAAKVRTYLYDDDSVVPHLHNC